MTTEISELIEELSNPCGIISERNSRLMQQAADALRRSSEQADEATSYHKFWLEERDKRIAAEKKLGKVRTLAGEVERCEHGHFLIDIAKAIRAVVSGSTEGGK